MWPIIQLSWRNIWRNPTRSIVIITAVILGTWAGIAMSAFMNGLSQQYLRDHLQNYSGHIQIHHKQYLEDNLPAYAIPDADSLIRYLKNQPFITALTPRSGVNGLASSAATNYGVTINGVEKHQEQQASHLFRYITKGAFLKDSVRNPIVIGAPLARRLSVTTDSRLVLNFQDVEGNITAGAFRVSGIFQSPNSGYDESQVFVKAKDINAILGESNLVHEIVIMTKDYKQAEQYASRLSRQLPDVLSIQSWGEVAPTLRYIDSNMDLSLYIIMVIIIVALMFGIINTMLMAVMERTQELGMLMAVGVNKIRTFAIIFWETLFLAMIGTPLGMGLSWATIFLLSRTGIDLSFAAEGLAEYGMRAVIYPELAPTYYLNIALLMFGATLLSSLFPAWKALRLNPVQAIRKL